MRKNFAVVYHIKYNLKFLKFVLFKFCTLVSILSLNFGYIKKYRSKIKF